MLVVVKDLLDIGDGAVRHVRGGVEVRDMDAGGGLEVMEVRRV